MVRRSRLGVIAVASVLSVFGCDDDDDGFIGGDDVVVRPDSGINLDAPIAARCFARTDLVADRSEVAARVDPDVVNAWGIASMDGAFWIANNGSGRLVAFDATGAPIRGGQAALSLGQGVTGIAVNTSDALVIPSTSRPVGLLVANENGQLIAIERGTTAERGTVVVNRSGEAASYKGVAILTTADGSVRVLAADFHNARIDVFDERFQLVTNLEFTDPGIPEGYAPFNIAVFGNAVYVTWARQDAEAADVVPGPGLGFVTRFDLAGGRAWTLTSQLLNAPWGLALVPAGAGLPANTLLVGNFGDGRLTLVDAERGTATMQLLDANNAPIAIDGLWGLAVGNGVAQADANALYFAAGPDDEAHGVHGVLTRCP